MAEVIASQNGVAATAGAGSESVSGVFGSSSYVVLVTTSWVTSYSVTGETSSAFTINWGTAPPAGATYDYTVVQLS